MNNFREGFKTLSETSGISWRVYPSTWSDAEIRDDWEAYGRVATGLTWEGFQSGPGRAFAHHAAISRQGSRALVTQFSGLDV
jgi:hypothetical protein